MLITAELLMNGAAVTGYKLAIIKVVISMLLYK